MSFPDIRAIKPRDRESRPITPNAGQIEGKETASEQNSKDLLLWVKISLMEFFKQN